MCPRNEFAPNISIQDALADNPLIMEEGFNISAPHMHAMLLEGLDLKPGHRYNMKLFALSSQMHMTQRWLRTCSLTSRIVPQQKLQKLQQMQRIS